MDGDSQQLKLEEMWKKRSLIRAPFNFYSDNWSNSYLIRRLIRRDIDSRFRGPWLGYLWAIIEPLLLALVYSFVFGLIVGKADKTYPAIVMVGVICWSLFARSWTTTTKTLSSNASMFQFTKIPKSVFAVSSILTNYTKFSLTFSSYSFHYSLRYQHWLVDTSSPILFAHSWTNWDEFRPTIGTFSHSRSRCCKSRQFFSEGWFLPFPSHVDI